LTFFCDRLQWLLSSYLYPNKGQLRRVNYAALDVEELGSVYESLLDFAPKVETREGIYQFKLVTGSGAAALAGRDRKTTGSYYTPPELVAQLIKTALEPVIEERLKDAEEQYKKDRDGNSDRNNNSFNNLEEQRSHYGEIQSAIAKLPEDKTGDIKQKQQQYRDTRKENLDNPWWRDTSACNLWTAAFFTPLTEQKLQLLPTSSALFQLLQGNWTTQKVVDAANKLAQEKRFFHWALEFPEVFENGGFDCVLGNPPWELLQIAEKEFFATRDSAIANAQNKAARTKL
jgi:hypothetical protein